MATNQPTSYDEIPYSDNCFPYTHPDNLAVVARLHGLTPPALEDCRVLELGCAGGGNLIPMAQVMPGAHFVGVDLSARQVASGRAFVEALGLRNIELRVMSITDIDPSFGTFDYILCHGVYSWVPEAAREKILEVCAKNMAPGGVAYISYNTFPGWHARGMVREMMGFHVRRMAGASDRVQEARAFLETLVQAVTDKASSYARIVRTEAEFLRGVGDSYLFHEHLEETNHPCYVHEFADRAAAHGLRLLGEALSGGLIDALPDESRAALEGWAGDPIAREQYLDFLCNRTFRRSLLCHEHLEPSPTPSAAALGGMWASSSAEPETERPEIASDTAETFRSRSLGSSLSTNNPKAKAAVMALYEIRPRALPLGELEERARELLASAPGADRGRWADGPLNLGEILLKCYLGNVVALHVHPPRFAPTAGERPEASPLARLQARDREKVTSLRHRSVPLEPFDRAVLQQLDGRRDRAEVVDVLVGLIADGTFTIYQGDQPLRDEAKIRLLVSEELEPCLARLAGGALLVS